MALFVGRRDVYATRFFSRKTGRHGWSPAEKEFWRKRDDAEREFLPLTDEVLIAHLSRPTRARLPCRAVSDAARRHLPVAGMRFRRRGLAGRRRRLRGCVYAGGHHTAAEISRSGAGVHVWMFFTEPVLAASAHAIGMGLLRETIDRRGTMSLTSYDRLFPAQDSLPTKAAPVEHAFADLKNWRILTKLRMDAAHATMLLRALLVLTHSEITR